MDRNALGNNRTHRPTITNISTFQNIPLYVALETYQRFLLWGCLWSRELWWQASCWAWTWWGRRRRGTPSHAALQPLQPRWTWLDDIQCQGSWPESPVADMPGDIGGDRGQSRRWGRGRSRSLINVGRQEISVANLSWHDCLPIASTGCTGTKNPWLSSVEVVVLSSSGTLWAGPVVFLFLLMLTCWLHSYR